MYECKSSSLRCDEQTRGGSSRTDSPSSEDDCLPAPQFRPVCRSQQYPFFSAFLSQVTRSVYCTLDDCGDHLSDLVPQDMRGSTSHSMSSTGTSGS